MRTRKDLWVFLPTLLAPGLAIALHGYLGSLSRLIADDFCSVYYSERFGFLRSIWYFRLTWSGRYSAYAADWLEAKTFGAYHVNWIPPLLLGIWLLLLIVTIHAALKKTVSISRAWPAAALLGITALFAILSLGPDVPQSLYWWNGLRTHTLPVVFFTPCILLYLIWPEGSAHRGWTWLGGFLFFALAVGGAGFSETFAVGQFFLLLFAIVLRIAAQKKVDERAIFLLAGLAGSILSLAVMATAPGNEIRLGEPDVYTPPGLVDLTRISIVTYLQMLAAIFLTPVKITALLGAVLLAAWLGAQYETVPGASRWTILTAAGGGILVSLACFPPGVYGYYDAPPPRTQIIPIYFLIAGLLCAGFLAGNLWKGRIVSHSIHSVLAGAAVLSLVFSGIWQAGALYGRRDTYLSYARIWDEQDAHILQAKAAGEASVSVPAVVSWAGVNALNDNPRFWVNICYSKYYGIPVFGLSPHSTQP